MVVEAVPAGAVVVADAFYLSVVVILVEWEMLISPCNAWRRSLQSMECLPSAQRFLSGSV